MASAKETVLQEVRLNVHTAAAKLSRMGGEYQRVAWLLEESLELLDEKDFYRAAPQVSELLESDDTEFTLSEAANS